ncbi:MAG: peptidylprolyl isomerase [Bacteroidetes bacterium]|nr:peptidylprolyl isomerase [Bacteroidota bacterium]
MIRIYASLVLLFSSSLLFAQQREPLDRIAAVINDEIILKSEIDMQAQYYAYSNNLYRVTPQLWSEILQNAVSNKIMLAKAKLDSISVPSAQVEADLDQRIDYLTQRLGSETAVRDYYGKSILQIRNELRDNIRKEKMVAQIKQKEFGSLAVTTPEVADFYTMFQDSMPLLPASAELYQIFIYPEQTAESQQKSLNKINAIKDSIKAGVSFEEMAKRHSEDGSASKGGDLGFFKRGELVSRFEAAAYELEPGQMSDVVETEFGYHLIQMIERRGESINTRHILIRSDKAALDHGAAIAKLTTWREEILSGKETFQNIAAVYSKDEFARNKGYMGKVPLNEMQDVMKNLVETTPSGDISVPAQISSSNGQTGYHIIWVKKKLPEHKMNLNDDKEELTSMALEHKRTTAFTNWLEKAKKDVFVEVRMSSPTD